MAAGHSVTGWNRAREKAAPLMAAGMRWADTPRAVAATSEIVFSIVTDAEAVRAVALGEHGVVAGLRKGGVYIDMSTIAPDASRAVAAEFAKAGSIMLDAPISGSPVTRDARQCLGHGGRRRGGVRAGQAGAAARSDRRCRTSARTGSPAR